MWGPSQIHCMFYRLGRIHKAPRIRPRDGGRLGRSGWGTLAEIVEKGVARKQFWPTLGALSILTGLSSRFEGRLHHARYRGGNLFRPDLQF